MIKFVFTLFMALLVNAASAQQNNSARQSSTDSVQLNTEEVRDLKFDIVDLKIIEKADLLLSDESKWNKLDDRLCDDDIANGKYSLYCALYKASLDVAGKFDHRRAALQQVRFIIEKFENGRVTEHRMKDFNNHTETTFAEVKKVLSESVKTVKDELN